MAQADLGHQVAESEARVAELERQVAESEARVAELEAQVAVPEAQEAELQSQAQDLEAKAPRAASSNQPAPMAEQAGFREFHDWEYLTSIWPIRRSV